MMNGCSRWDAATITMFACATILISSRNHARLYLRGEHWWLEDCNSKNGTFIEEDDEDARVSGMIELSPGQLFRVGRTWLRIQTEGE